MATAQNVMDLARIPLNDNGKVRWSDPELLQHLNQGLEQIRRARPDLFDVWTDFSLIVTDTVPLAAAYHQNLADYVAARAFAKDDEEVIAKATAFFTLGSAGL